ncbi:MAG TPA: energy-coupling factor transporter transmembrane component T [Syntrophobacteraceae bacterium]|jgi:energy-coupling factor transport system permease protein|nr:energy-coupling factor transporter transmembrane component T [Syntrophobacteraceae bacterium]
MMVKYTEGSSLLHRLNPVAKLSVVVSYSLIVFLLDSLQLEGLCLGAVLAAERSIGSRQITAMMLSRFALVLVIFIVAMQAVMTQSGTVLISIPVYYAQLRITDAGLLNGIVVALRFLSVVLVSALLIVTTSPADLVYSLMRAGIPYRYGFMVILVMRLITVYRLELKTVTNAQKMRGLRVDESGIRGLVRCIRCTVMPLIVSGLSRVDSLVVSMEGRAFGCKKTRTFVNEDHYGLLDKILIVGCSSLVLLTLLDIAFGWYPLPHLMP